MTNSQPKSTITFPSNLATALKLDAKRARLLAGRAIRDPHTLAVPEILAMAFEVVRILDEKELANNACGLKTPTRHA